MRPGIGYGCWSVVCPSEGCSERAPEVATCRCPYFGSEWLHGRGGLRTRVVVGAMPTAHCDLISWVVSNDWAGSCRGLTSGTVLAYLIAALAHRGIPQRPRQLSSTGEGSTMGHQGLAEASDRVIDDCGWASPPRHLLHPQGCSGCSGVGQAGGVGEARLGTLVAGACAPKQTAPCLADTTQSP